MSSMKTLVGVLAGCALVAPAAHATTANIEISGVTGAIAPQADYVLGSGTINKTSDPSKTCSASSALGLLDQAVAGDWNGSFFGGLGYAVERVKTETHDFSQTGDNHYWAVYRNGIQADLGLCGLNTTDGTLQEGDRIQLVPDCAGTVDARCFDAPLQLRAPATAKPGVAFGVTVTETTNTPGPNFSTISTNAASSGATVAGVRTDGAGKASITLTDRGPQRVTATKGTRAPSTAVVCVTDGADGFCGTTKPGDPTPPAGPAAPCATNGADGRCGTTDRSPAYATITAVTEGKRFAKGQGPRTLAGTVETDPSGLKDVRIRLTRTLKGRCSQFSGKSERFVALKRCGAANAQYFSIGDRAAFSYLLPAKLGPGRYVLDVVTTDGAGNTSKLARGTSRVVFFVS